MNDKEFTRFFSSIKGEKIGSDCEKVKRVFW